MMIGTDSVRLEGAVTHLRPAPGGALVASVETNRATLTVVLPEIFVGKIALGDILRASFRISQGYGYLAPAALDYSAPIEVSPLNAWGVIVDLVVARTMLAKDNPQAASVVLNRVADRTAESLQLAASILGKGKRPQHWVGKNQKIPVADALEILAVNFDKAIGAVTDAHAVVKSGTGVDHRADAAGEPSKLARAAEDSHLVEAINLLAPSSAAAEVVLAIDHVSWFGKLRDNHLSEREKTILTARSATIGTSTSFPEQAQETGYASWQSIKLD